MNSRFSSRVLWFQQHKLSKMKKSTVKTMSGHIALYLIPAFAHCTLRTITADRVNEWLSSDAVSHLSPTTMKHIVTTLTLITEIKYGRRAIRYPASRALKEEAPCFTPEEMTEIISESEGADKVYYATASETGARSGELNGIEITDIDFIRNQIHIRRSVYDGEVQTPKTQNAYRVVDVQPWLIKLIKQHIGDRKTGLLFMNKRGQALRNTTVLRRHLHPLLKKLGIKKCGMHAFRHGRVSYLVEQGVSRDIIRAWIGHGSDAMIERYLHLRTSYRAAALANVKPLQPNHPMVMPSTSGGSFAVGA
jgi:integrase